MTDLEKRVFDTFKFKKSQEYCARYLDIPIKRYIQIKKKIKHQLKMESKKAQIKANPEAASTVNLDSGQAKLSAKSFVEPKDANEIIKILNIDTTKWKLSQYWNKQMSDHWRISALVTQIQGDDLINIQELIKNWKPKKYKLPDLYRPSGFEIAPQREDVCGIMSLQDIHFGKEGNETVDKDFEDAICYLIKKSIVTYNIKVLYFVVGGDLINMDTFSGTTTSGTPLDNSMSATEAYVQAFDAMHWAINLLKKYCEEIVVVYVPGNHDRLSSFHLVHALEKSIGDENITWDTKYEERKVHVWNNNFNAFEHGDATSKNTPIIYATEFPIEWGTAKNRTLFTGHFHQNKTVEYITTSETAGFIHKTLPSLSKTDYYHYHKKYTGNRRSGKLELQLPDKGNICELTYLAD